jgi:phi13 family phage major tail protein
MPTEAKVFYGLSNVHYALLTETVDSQTGVITTSYGTPKLWPGAVNIALDPSGNPIIFSADNTAYYTIANNQGYEGDFECALIPDEIRTDTLGNKKDENGVVIETDHDQISYFALMFEFNTDKNPNRYVFYKVSLAQRPSTASETVDVTSDISIKTDKVKFKAMPQASATTIDGVECHLVKAFTSQDVDATTYAGFYHAVYTPDFDNGQG